jgi:predicted Rossmann fold nucleotide-binding protein DprA/Smf involved in DNA uptake
MARKRKYKTLDPYDVSRTAWEHLTEAKKIDQMVTNYSSEMRLLPQNVDARNRYIAGLGLWVTIMRRREIKDAISDAIAKAKKSMREMIETARARVVEVTAR